VSRGTDNAFVADALDEIADLLEAQHADAFRVHAYRNAASTARASAEPLAELVHASGPRALETLPAIGRSIAGSIRELIELGHCRVLDRLRGRVSPEDLFTTIPGIGEELAARIHAELGVETLEQLEVAAHDGRLEQVPGFGKRRARSVRDLLSARLSSRRASISLAEEPGERPPVSVVLDVDREYREREQRGELRRIAPRRFNPSGEAWLPILHTRRDDWQLTALYSNTARAHERGTTRDWVVVHCDRDGHEDQCTVVTENRGPLEGRRVVRGREAECRSYYAAAT
jgi:hypothetical protein